MFLVIRLDFDNFILASPEATDNTCLYDQFYVTGGSSPISTICGTNSGAHSKLDVSTEGGLKARIEQYLSWP